jgi:signal transduction histidine kinase
MTHTGKPLGHADAGVITPRAHIGRVASLNDHLTVGLIHDLGNLIQVASSAVRLMARGSGAEAAVDLQPLIAGARTALDRASAIVRQTIASARNDASILEHVNVTACLAEIGKLTRHMWTSSTWLDIATSSDSLTVTSSGLSLQNAILNLIFNARDAMPNGGIVTVLAREIANAQGGTDVEIRVLDTGRGMTREMAARAFDPYFTTKTSGSGGVGLSMVKRFADEAGGSVVIDSQPGVGTNVTLRLPAAMAPSATLSSIRQAASRVDARETAGKTPSLSS